MLLDLLYSEDIDIKDLEKYFLASSQGQVPGFLPKNFITNNTWRNCRHASCLYYFIRWRDFFIKKNKFQDVIFTAIMATIMVYGMIVYNVALNMGGVRGETFIAALHEMPIMVPIAFILEFFVVGKIARMLAFTVMRPDDRPQFITYAISICICCIMCPIMSLIATILFKDTKDFPTWIQTWGMNFPMAILYQMFYCGPLVRLIFRAIFREKK